MRIKRKKNFRKHMAFYRSNFKFRESYRVLIDGTFINDALKNRINIREQLPQIVGGKIVPMVTQCVLTELKNMGPDFAGSVHIAKQFYRLKCGCDTVKPADQCMIDTVGKDNSSHYCVCTQDKKLRHHMRAIPAVPLLAMYGQVPFLEAPSQKTKTTWESEEQGKLGTKSWETKALPVLRSKEVARQEKKKKRLEAEKEGKDLKKKVKKYGKKGPNPLACRKKKVKAVVPQQSSAQADDAPKKTKKTRSRRNRNSNPAEVAEAVAA